MSLAYPGKTGSFSDVVARDAFLDGLNDPQLKINILEREPEPNTIEEALRIACRLEALRRNADDDHFKELKTKEKNVRAAAVSGQSETDKLQCHIKELENSPTDHKKKLQDVTSLAQELQQCVTVAEETVCCGSEQSTQQTVENSQYTNHDGDNSYGRG